MLNFSHYIHFSRLLSNRTITKTQQELHLLPEMSIPWYLVLLLFKEERVTHTSGAAFARLLSLVFVRSFVISRNKLETNSHPILNKAHAWPGHRLYKGGFGSFWFRFRLEIWFTFHTAFRTSPVISSAMINTRITNERRPRFILNTASSQTHLYTHTTLFIFFQLKRSEVQENSESPPTPTLNHMRQKPKPDALVRCLHQSTCVCMFDSGINRGKMEAGFYA